MGAPRTGHKFTEARSFLLSLSAETDQNSPAFRHQLSAFLNAAYSMIQRLKLEAKTALKAGADNKWQAKAKFDAWLTKWVEGLPEDEQALWNAMKTLRGKEVHDLGAQIVTGPQPTPADPHRIVHYFEIGSKRVEVVDACCQYERLLQRLLANFLGSPPDAGP